MKTKFWIPLLAFVLLSFAGTAQKIPFLQVGIKGGVNITKVDGKSFSDEFMYGYHLGGFAQLRLGEKWQLQPEVLFNQYNTKVDTTLSNVIHIENFKNVKLNYLSIPVLLSYSPTKLISFQAGPQFGILLDKNKNLFENGKDAFKAGDLSLLGGVQLNLANFRVSGRYFIGLADINDAGNSDKWKNQGFQVSVGLRII